MHGFSLFCPYYQYQFSYIGNLVLAYGYGQAFRQITLPLLVGIGTLMAYYAILVFGLKNSDSSLLLSKVVFGVVLVIFGAWFIRESRINLVHINQVLSD